MTSPVLSSRFIWCMRLLASALAVWAIYRHLLRPDWSVRMTVGSEVFDTYRRFWLWESPVASEQGGVPGDIRWGRSLCLLAGYVFMAVGTWRLPVPVGSVPRHPNTTQQPTGAPSGAGG
jgi:hypothetical protein